MYVYLREAFGPAVAFVYGWVFLLVNPVAWAGIALIGAEHLSAPYPLTATQFVLGMWIVYALAVLGLFRLRSRRADAARPYRVPGCPMVPLVFVLSAVGLLASAVVELPLISLAHVVVVTSGVPVYLVWRRLTG